MDIAELAIYMKQTNISQQIGLAVTKKVMDVSEDSSMEMIKMLETSVNPDLGTMLDVRV